MNDITRRGLTAIAEEMNCISKSSHNIAGTLAAMIGAEDALNYADSGNTNNQDIFCIGNVQGMIIADESLIEEAKAMILQMKIEGSVRVRSNGLLEFRNPLFGSVYGRSVEELQEKLNKKVREQKSRIKQPVKRNLCPKFSEFYTKTYLPYKIQTKRAKNTLDGYRANYNYIVTHDFDKRLNTYTTKDIESFLFSIKATRKRQIMQGFLNNLFNRALALSLIKSNPCSPIERMEHETEEGKALSFEDQMTFFSGLLSAENISFDRKCYYLFQYLTGTRRDEGRMLTVNDVNFEKKILIIRGTKTEKSNRKIPLFPIVEKLLKCLRTQDRYFKLGTFAASHYFTNFIENYKLHDLRHTFGSIQIHVKKVDIKTVSLWMGHSDIKTTLKTYTHPEQLDPMTFLRGDKTEDEKFQILRRQYDEIYDMIDHFLDDHTHTVPKSYPK